MMSRGDVEEVALVLDRDQRPLGTVVHGDLQRLGERPQRLDVPLDAHVAEDQSAAVTERLADRRVGRDEESHADLGLDPIVQAVDDLDVEVRGVHFAADAEIGLPRQR